MTEEKSAGRTNETLEKSVLDKLENHAQALSQLNATVKAHDEKFIGQDARLDRIMQESASSKAEILAVLNRLIDKVDLIDQHYHVNKGIEEGRKENRQWTRWLVPTVVTIISLLVGLGIIGGVTQAESAELTQGILVEYYDR